MEAAIGIVGVALAFLGMILGFMWRANGRYIRELQAGQKEIAKGIEGIAQLGKVMALYYIQRLRREEVSPDMQDVYRELERIVKG
jgi:hypothetical protein